MLGHCAVVKSKLEAVYNFVFAQNSRHYWKQMHSFSNTKDEAIPAHKRNSFLRLQKANNPK